MWTNEREKLSFQFAKYGLVNTNIFDVASSNAQLTFSWRQPPLLPRGNAPKTSDLQFFQVSCAFSVFCSMSYVACHACALSSVYLLFIFVPFEFCVFVLNKMFTIKDTKLLAGRGLRDASDVLQPCKKLRIKPWRPMLYWTGAEEYVYPFNVNLCFFELLTSGSKTARNILPWLWLIFEDNFVLLGQVLVGVHSWNRSWRIWKKEYSQQFTKVKIHTCILWLTTELYHYVKYEVKQCFSQLVSFSTERTGDDLAHCNHVFVNSRKWYLSFDCWISIKVSFTFQLHFPQTALA